MIWLCLCVQQQPFTAEAVAFACNAPTSSKTFRQAILSVIVRNVRVDLRHAFNASFHFDEEMFISGRKIITEGLRAVKASNRLEDYEAAREKLGEILHPLQVIHNFSKNQYRFKHWFTFRDIIHLLLSCYRISTVTVTGWKWGTTSQTPIWSDRTPALGT